MIDVILETGDNRRKMVAKALEGLSDDFVDKIKSAQNILIKVDLAHHDRQIVSTHIDTVRGILDVIRQHCRTKIYIGDGAYYGTSAAFHQLGYERLSDEYNHTELVDLNDDEYIDGWIFDRHGEKKEIRRSKLAEICDLKIVVASPKVHPQAGLAASVYSWSIGSWIVPSRISSEGRVWARWPWLQDEGAWAHHASIASIFKQNKCDYAVIDGVYGMEANGPVDGTMVKMGLMLAGSDPVAVDAVCATLMGIDPADIGYLSMLNEQGVGSINMAKINIPPMQLMQYKQDFELPLNLKNHLRDWVTETT